MVIGSSRWTVISDVQSIERYYTWCNGNATDKKEFDVNGKMDVKKDRSRSLSFVRLRRL